MSEEIFKCVNNIGVEDELKVGKYYEPIQDWFDGEWEILNENGYCRMYNGCRFEKVKNSFSILHTSGIYKEPSVH